MKGKTNSKGLEHSAETKAKISGAIKGKNNRKGTAETMAKMPAAKKRRGV